MQDVNDEETCSGIERIGNSKYYFGVWYKITNKDALVPCGHCGNGWDMDNKKRPATYFVGDYSREKFNSVKFILDIWERNSSFDGTPDYEVAVHCFADTRECGAETIVHYRTDNLDTIDKRLLDYTAKVLSRSGAVVDAELNRQRIIHNQNEINSLLAINTKLTNIIAGG